MHSERSFSPCNGVLHMLQSLSPLPQSHYPPRSSPYQLPAAAARQLSPPNRLTRSASPVDPLEMDLPAAQRRGPSPQEMREDRSPPAPRAPGGREPLLLPPRKRSPLQDNPTSCKVGKCSVEMGINCSRVKFNIISISNSLINSTVNNFLQITK